MPRVEAPDSHGKRQQGPGKPFNLKADLSDSLSQRDTGWLQFYCESGQEVFDTIIQSYKISEKLLLPVMVNLEGFILSHTYEIVDLPEQSQIDLFLPPAPARECLDVDNPCMFGSTTDYYINFRYKMHQDMEEAKTLCREIDAEFKKAFGRDYGLVQPISVKMPTLYWLQQEQSPAHVASLPTAAGPGE